MWTINLYHRYRRGSSIDQLAIETGMSPELIRERIRWVVDSYDRLPPRMRSLVDQY
jgi:hypothetical protein